MSPVPPLSRSRASWVLFGLTAAGLALSIVFAWIPLGGWDQAGRLTAEVPEADRQRSLWLVFAASVVGALLLVLLTNLVSPARDPSRSPRPAVVLVALSAVLVVVATGVLAAVGAIAMGSAVVCGAVMLLLFLGSPLLEVLALARAVRLRREDAAVRR